MRDLFVTDVEEATVVTIYLLPIAMDRLERKLAGELAPGTRVVSHDYPLRGWRAERIVALDVPEKPTTPAAAAPPSIFTWSRKKP